MRLNLATAYSDRKGKEKIRNLFCILMDAQYTNDE